MYVVIHSSTYFPIVDAGLWRPLFLNFFASRCFGYPEVVSLRVTTNNGLKVRCQSELNTC